MAYALVSRSRGSAAAPVTRVRRHGPGGRAGLAGKGQGQGTLAHPQAAALTALPALQTKLKVGAPNDRFEQEADRVADQVMRMAPPQRTGPINLDGQASPDGVQRLCGQCEDEIRRQPIEEEEEELQMKRRSGAMPEIGPGLQAQISGLGGGGQPLSPSLRCFFEPRFGHDFGRVRVHADSDAADGARAVRARAYTVGRDIVFGSGEYAPATMEGKRLLAHELTHVLQQESAPAAGQRPTGSAIAPSGTDAPVLQRKLECSLEHIEKECAGAAGACLTAKDYCAKKYPNSKDIDQLHANAVKGATEYKSKFPNAADNLLHFLTGSGTEKVMKVDLFRDHPVTQQKYGEHMARFKEGGRKRFEAGKLKIGGPAVEMVWTDTANAFGSDFNDLGLAVGGYTLCSKVSASAKDPKEVGGSKDFLWLRFDPWTIQAFDCYNWDPGKGIGLPFATDNDLCCLQNAGRAKHFRVRTDPWPLAFPPESVPLSPEEAPSKPPTSPPPKPKDDDR
ncbi:MAG: DUF4157 domain-containing protein [Gammaproteobacteria bacterium]